MQRLALSAQQNDHPLTNVVANETSSLGADPSAKPGQPGSAEDLAAGRQAVAEVANRLLDARHPGQVAPTDLTDPVAAGINRNDPKALDAYQQSRVAADLALGGSNITNGATQYRTRVGTNVRTNLGRTSKKHPGTPVSQHYGPFIEGHHKVVIVVAP
jgi:hypothetical protein